MKDPSKSIRGIEPPVSIPASLPPEVAVIAVVGRVVEWWSMQRALR